MMGYIKAQSLVFLQKNFFFQMQVEIANFVCSTEEEKSFSLQFSTIVCAHEEWQRFQQFLNIPKEFLFTVVEKAVLILRSSAVGAKLTKAPLV